MGVSLATRTAKKLPAIQERRINMRLMAYWQELRNDRGRALSSAFDPDEISDVWPNCFCLDPNADRSESEFRHIGEGIAADSGVPENCRRIKDVPRKTLMGQMLRHVPALLEGKTPVVESGRFTDKDKQKYLFRGILLPFTNGRGQIDMIIGGARYKPISK